jgi:hypothetical protein
MTLFSTIVGSIIDIFKSPVLISWVIAIAALITLTAMSVPKLRATRISASEIVVTFNTPPIWIHESLLIEIKNIARAHLSQTTVGRDGLIETADALERTGWFTQVHQVKWISDKEASIDATFLTPYAKVHDIESDVYIDSQGRRLPTRNGSIVTPNYHFITFTNPSHNRPQNAGAIWNGEDILDSLKVLHIVYDKNWSTQIQKFDLANWDHSGSITFITGTPSRFVWGSAPNQERRLEALAQNKINRLNWLHSNYGKIDNGISAEFDLTDIGQVTIK